MIEVSRRKPHMLSLFDDLSVRAGVILAKAQKHKQYLTSPRTNSYVAGVKVFFKNTDGHV